MKKEVYNRLLEEKSELNKKAVKLQCFIESDDFEKLSDANKVLLNVQLGIMYDYLSILTVRIELNQPQENEN